MNKLFQRIALLFTIVLAVLTTAAAAQEHQFCWRDSYGRGVGTIPGSCSGDMEKVGLLCYQRCEAGMTRVGLDCHSVCPADMRNDGLFCRRSEYGRGGGYPWKFKDGLRHPDRGMESRCESDHGAGNCEKQGAMYYARCKPGYTNIGLICRPHQPDCAALGLGGRFDLSCAKIVKIASAPKTGVCSANDSYDAGLCYKQCNAGYSGVGPVCWGKSPSGWGDCGMGSSKDAKTCASIIFGQVASVGTLALTVATAGASDAATTAETAAEDSGKIATLKRNYDELKAAYEAAKKASPALQQSETAFLTSKDIASVGSKTFTSLNTASNAVTAEDIARASAQMAAIVDGSGVSATIAAYTYPKCSQYFGPQSVVPAR